MGATPIIIKYPLDLTGSASSNAIVNELHTVPRDNSRGFALDYGPFYSESLVITRPSTGEILKPHIDYIALHQYQEATLIAGQEICAAVLIINETIAEELSVSYQVVGGGFSSSVSVIQELVEALQLDNRAVAWGDIIGKLEAFPAAPHYHDLDDFYGFEYMVSALDRIESAIMHGDYYDHELLRQRIANLRAELLQAIDDQAESQTLHLGDFANPHKVTKAQVGLGNVANFGTATNADGAAGTSTTLFMTPAAVFAAIVAKAGAMLEGHTSRVDNPHNTTKAQVGLGSVANFAVASTAEAQIGDATDKYMTPYLVKVAIDTLVGGLLSTHINRVDNPHATTAAQVGLGNVDNFATASQAEAQAVGATATLPLNKFMTVRRVAEMIDARAGTQLIAHINNTNNPHATTAEQIGLGLVSNYATAQVVDVNNFATDKFMTPALSKVMIGNLVGDTLTAHITNHENPHGTTAKHVGLGFVQNYPVASSAEAQQGTRNDLYMTPALVNAAIQKIVGDGWVPKSKLANSWLGWGGVYDRVPVVSSAGEMAIGRRITFYSSNSNAIVGELEVRVGGVAPAPVTTNRGAEFYINGYLNCIDTYHRSDLRDKVNVAELDWARADSVLTSIRNGITYGLMDAYDKTAGLAAQVVQKYFPEAVVEILNDKGEPRLAIRDGALIGLLVSGYNHHDSVLQQQSEQLRVLNDKVTELVEINSSLVKRIEELERK